MKPIQESGQISILNMIDKNIFQKSLLQETIDLLVEINDSKSNGSLISDYSSTKVLEILSLLKSDLTIEQLLYLETQLNRAETRFYYERLLSLISNNETLDLSDTNVELRNQISNLEKRLRKAKV